MRRDPGILCRGLDVRGDETCHDAGDVVPRDADVFQLPVVEAMKRGGRLAAMPALRSARETRPATVARKPGTGPDAGWVPDCLNSDMIAAPFTELIEPPAQECAGGVHGVGCVPVGARRRDMLDCRLGIPEAANACVRAARG